MLQKAELVNNDTIDTGTQADSWSTALATKPFYKHSHITTPLVSSSTLLF